MKARTDHFDERARLIDMLARCARHQPRVDVPSATNDPEHFNHPAVIKDEHDGPNLRLWTGRAHILVLQLKRDRDE